MRSSPTAVKGYLTLRSMKVTARFISVNPRVRLTATPKVASAKLLKSLFCFAAGVFEGSGGGLTSFELRNW